MSIDVGTHTFEEIIEGQDLTPNCDRCWLHHSIEAPAVFVCDAPGHNGCGGNEPPWLMCDPCAHATGKCMFCHTQGTYRIIDLL